MSAPEIHSGHMEVAVAELIGYRENTIVPNVSWGFGLMHECDLLVLDKKMRLTEVEIKVSKSDLKADFKKPHGHKSEIITRLIYAVPDFLVDDAKALVPENNGIISVSWRNSLGYRASWVRLCKHKKTDIRVGESIALNLTRLGCMRIWSLKRRIYYKRGTA